MADEKSVAQIRIAAGLSKTEAAAMARCSPLTWRLFEVDQSAVSEQKRRDCSNAVEAMRRHLESRGVGA